MKDQNWLAFYFQLVISAYVFGDNLVEDHFAEYETIQTDGRRNQSRVLNVAWQHRFFRGYNYNKHIHDETVNDTREGRLTLKY